ncbi:MAG: ATP-binding protein [Acidobacteriota bacterium]
MNVESSVKPADFLMGGGEMGARMRELDWSRTSLGPAQHWPRSLKTAVRIMLTCRQPMFVWWGPELINLYNDAYRSVMAGKHPWGLGRPAALVWREIWDDVGPRARSAMELNEGTYDEALLLIMERNGYPEETYYTFSYSPVPDDDGRPNGIICANTEDTLRILSDRRLALFGELAVRTADARTFEEACTRAADGLETNRADLPFAMIYLIDAERQTAVLAGASGIEAGHPAAPREIALTEGAVWPFAEVLRAHGPVFSDLDDRFGELPSGPWKRPPMRAITVPIAPTGQTGKSGLLVAALNPYRLFDESYRGFVELVAGQISATIGNAQAYEDERKRAEALVELDRAKTTFFSNVSHEFRTPLTLMLGPVEDILGEPEGRLQPEQRELLKVVQRNALRLQKLVNTLLDFSRIEAGRTQASYEETAIASLTAELASTFRSAIEKAGLRFVVDTAPVTLPVFVDRDMWEKIVLNLLSNAFKFTLDGEIAIRIRQHDHNVVLTVSDTGSGIPATELPHLFKRFHRVEGTTRRTHEGTGIGLALVQELVKLHGGSIDVESTEGVGTTFTISIPGGSAHLPAERLGSGRTLASTSIGIDLYVEEARQWLPRSESPAAASDQPSEHRPRVVLADDNADMREYVRQLLAQRYDVVVCPDGRVALDEIRRHLPELLLTDVMMPEMDGFTLLAEIRRDPRLVGLPVIMLSARSGEEATIEGIEAGADDYLVKPFTARELMARVSAQIDTAAIRREAQRAVAESEERLRSIINQTTAGIAQTDLEGNFVFVNDRFCDMTGRPLEELFRLRVQDITHPDDLESNRALFRALVQEGMTFVAENRFVRGDGSSIWVSNSVSRVVESSGEAKLLTVSIDITDRKRAEEALRRSEERYSEMANNAPVMSWMTDPTGVCTFLSRSWYEFTGQTPETGLGFGWLNATHPDDRASSEGAFVEANAKRQPFRAEYRLRRVDGEYCWAIESALPRIGPEGEYLGYIGSVVDISDRKQAEDALQESARALREADRLKDEFLATLSHELRTPLTSILGWAQLLSVNELSEGERRVAYETIRRSAMTQSELIEDVLDISRITTGKMRIHRQAHDPGTVVAAAVDTVRPAAEAKNITIEVSLDPALSQLYADPDRVQQILWNLLSNAIKFSSSGTKVTVTLRRDASSAVIEVSDEGPGIPRQFLPHVFERFRQADSSSTRTTAGLGIGLALVKELTQLHGGSVAVESEEGKGAHFTIALPLAEKRELPPESLPATEGPSRMTALSGLHVLFVDDSEDARNLIGTILRSRGANVDHAATVAEALTLVGRELPDVIITDIAMPGNDGFDLLRRIRADETARHLPVLALTAQSSRGDEAAATEAGFHRYLRKPIDADELVGHLTGIVKRPVDG